MAKRGLSRSFSSTATMPSEDDEIRRLQEERERGVKLDAASVAFDKVCSCDIYGRVYAFWNRLFCVYNGACVSDFAMSVGIAVLWCGVGSIVFLVMYV